MATKQPQSQTQTPPEETVDPDLMPVDPEQKWPEGVTPTVMRRRMKRRIFAPPEQPAATPEPAPAQPVTETEKAGDSHGV